ncbi:MAG: ATP-grasp domain-containing protein [Cyanothece sp. SIO1E1]|nr:ATP-grasp domain-containing protein [Cyanothece sp. SIO1E1]
MKIIAVFFQAAGALAYPLHTEQYIWRFTHLGMAVESYGGQFRIVRHQSSYLGSGHFAHSWALRDGKVIEAGPITANVVFDKGRFMTDGAIPVFNCQEISEICTNKYRTFELFQAYCPQTYRVETEQEFCAALKKLPGSEKVMKPIDGLEGKDVYIGSSEYLQQQQRRYPLLVQEFLDSQEGIPGIVEGIHDFRVAILNGEIVYSLVRIPAPGELVAGMSRGSTMQVVDTDNIPQVIVKLVAEIDRKLAPYGARFYGIDLALVKGQPRIIELNSRVGLGDNARHASFKIAKDKLAQVLLSLCQGSVKVASSSDS